MVDSDLFGVSFLDQVADLVRASGLDEVVGEEEIQAGLRRFAAGAMPLAGELCEAQELGESLADIVCEPTRFLHATTTHGFLRDLLVMPMPEPLVPWAERIVRAGPPPEAPRLRRAMVSTAVRDPNPVKRTLTRFALFEALCFNQRVFLLAQGVQLEALAGRRSDVEIIAEQEVAVLLEDFSTYQDELLGLDDPLKPLVASALVVLDNHLDVLRAGLKEIRAHFHDVVERRRRLLEIMDHLPPESAVLLYNETAHEFGEQQYEANELRVLHPGLLGEISRDAIYKRVERLPDQVSRLVAKPVARGRAPSFADLVLGQYEEESA